MKDRDEWRWKVYFRGNFIGETTTKDRHLFLENAITNGNISKEYSAGELEFNLIIDSISEI